MAKTKKKALTLSAIKEETKKYKEQIVVDIKGYELKIDKHFAPTKISELLQELGSKILQLEKDGVDLKNFDLTSYIFLLIIKHFTSLKIPDEFEKQIAILKELVDGEFLGEIINAIPDDGWNKLQDVFYELNERFDQTKEMLKNLVEEQENKIAKENNTQKEIEDE